MNIDDLKNAVKHRDKPLHFNRMPVDEKALMAKLHQHFIFKPITRKLRARALLALVVIAVRNSLFGHFTSYSRRKDWYTGLSDFYDPSFTYSHIIAALEAVEDTGMFINLIQSPGSNHSEQSAFMASPELIEACYDIETFQKRREIILVKDDNGRPVFIPDTEFSIKRRSDIESFNNWYETSVEISFDRQCHQYGNWYYVEGQFVEPGPIHLYSVFNRGSYDFGGRVYGWHTSLKKKVRAKIRLNGQECQELDYNQLHPTMLFAKVGRQIDRDIYNIGNLDRKIYKRSFLAALNGSNAASAGYSMFENDDEFDLSLNDARYIVQRMVESTPELKDYFFTDMGVKLQREDSEIIISVMKRLVSLSIPHLTIHDSVIVPVDRVSLTRHIMTDTYSQFYPGYSCSVS